MASSYYKPCTELTRCDELIEQYWMTGDYASCFLGHLELADQGYPLAECQVGYFYRYGYGVTPDPQKSLYWTRRAAEHGDRDAQYNLGTYYEAGYALPKNAELALEWYQKAAAQGQENAVSKLRVLGV